MLQCHLLGKKRKALIPKVNKASLKKNVPSSNVLVEAHLIKYHEKKKKPTVIWFHKKENGNFSNSQTQSLEDWYLTNRGFKTAVVNSVSYKKSQKGNPVNSGIKLLKRCKFPKNTKIIKNRKNSEAEELNI